MAAQSNWSAKQVNILLEYRDSFPERSLVDLVQLSELVLAEHPEFGKTGTAIRHKLSDIYNGKVVFREKTAPKEIPKSFPPSKHKPAWAHSFKTNGQLQQPGDSNARK